jgi:hypothetical protein
MTFTSFRYSPTQDNYSFLSSVRRISQPRYISIDKDVIMARVRSTELHRAIGTLSSGGITFELTDIGGQRVNHRSGNKFS